MIVPSGWRNDVAVAHSTITPEKLVIDMSCWNDDRLQDLHCRI